MIRKSSGIHSGFNKTGTPVGTPWHKMADESEPEVKKPRLESSPPLYGSLELIYHDSADKMQKRWDRFETVLTIFEHKITNDVHGLIVSQGVGLGSWTLVSFLLSPLNSKHLCRFQLLDENIVYILCTKL